MKRIHFDVETEGFYGASTTGTLALTAAAYFPDITLTIAMTPSDFIWQGFMQGEKDGCKEWPIEGESLFSYLGKPLPYMPFVYQHPKYWQVVQAESKRAGDMLNSRKLFDDSEAAHPLQEEEMIPVENIKGKLLAIGSGLFVKLALHAAREYPKECKTTREDIDRRISKVLEEWRQ